MNNFEATLQELQEIDSLIHQAITRLQTVLGGKVNKLTVRVTGNRTTGTKKRHLSAAAKKSISDAMTKRWAEKKKNAVSGVRRGSPTLVGGKKPAKAA